MEKGPKNQGDSYNPWVDSDLPTEAKKQDQAYDQPQEKQNDLEAAKAKRAEWVDRGNKLTYPGKNWAGYVDSATNLPFPGVRVEDTLANIEKIDQAETEAERAEIYDGGNIRDIRAAVALSKHGPEFMLKAFHDHEQTPNERDLKYIHKLRDENLEYAKAANEELSETATALDRFNRGAEVTFVDRYDDWRKEIEARFDDPAAGKNLGTALEIMEKLADMEKLVGKVDKATLRELLAEKDIPERDRKDVDELVYKFSRLGPRYILDTRELKLGDKLQLYKQERDYGVQEYRDKHGPLSAYDGDVRGASEKVRNRLHLKLDEITTAAS